MGENTDVYECTLTEQQSHQRIDADRALADRVVGTERTRNGVRVSFAADDDTAGLVDTFVTNESRCCGFFDFSVDSTDGSVTLQMTAPAAGSAQQLVDGAKRAFDLGPDGVEPIQYQEPDGG